MTDYVLHASAGFINLSPDAFRMWARHYYKCKLDFKAPDRFSPVPYFLLCRAIELAIKAEHLEDKNRSEVKDEFRHNLVKAYEGLTPEHKILNAEELRVLATANEIYCGKGFEYFNPEHALRGYSNFPDLAALDAIAAKFIRPG